MSDNLINRITHFESILNTASEDVESLKTAFEKLKSTEADITELFDYYGSKEWFEHRKNYDDGLIPRNVPCGILSEDAIYDLLCDCFYLIKDMKEFCEKIAIVPHEETDDQAGT